MNDILRRLYQAFDPVRPLQPEDEALYVELDDVRGSVGVVAKLAENIRLSDSPTCQLLTGHRGSGKSTELGRLKHQLESGRVARPVRRSGFNIPQSPPSCPPPPSFPRKRESRNPQTRRVRWPDL